MNKIVTKNKDIFIVNETDCNERKSLLNIKNTNNLNSIYIYKSEYENKREIIDELINYHNDEIDIRVYARKCNIELIHDSHIKGEFLNNNHIQGNDKSTIIYGAYYNNELVAIMSFDDKRNMSSGVKTNSYELSRFCTKKGINVIGIFNKLLKCFIINFKPSKIISFADRRFTLRDKNIYSSNGFRLIKTLPCDYKYYNKLNPQKLLHKFGFGKSSIKKKYPLYYDIKKTEYEMMFDIGYTRVWDCGKYRYELDIDKNNNTIFGFIYKIMNKSNNKIYIGQTTRNLNKRIYEYKKALNSESFYNKILQNSFKKYGWNNFEFTIIDTAISLFDLNEKEIYYINKYNSRDKNLGYNIELGGRNSIPSEETIRKMSVAGIGRKQSQEWIYKRIPLKGSKEALKHGRTKTEKQKKHLSDISPKYWSGKTRSKETIDKISTTKKKNGLNDLQKKILCKKVISYNPITNEVINIFESTNEASKYYSISQSTISRRCCGVTKNKGNIYFKYM
jgi:group I intron endonuclease